MSDSGSTGALGSRPEPTEAIVSPVRTSRTKTAPRAWESSRSRRTRPSISDRVAAWASGDRHMAAVRTSRTGLREIRSAGLQRGDRGGIVARGLVASPDSDSGGGREVEPLARLDAEGVVPRVDVANRVGAVLPGRMAVGHQLDALELRTHLRAPGLRECQKESL